MSRTILLTGFDPFGGESVNPAFAAVRALPDQIGGAQLCKLELPTAFFSSGALLKKTVEQLRPDAVVCIGQAGGRAAITPERVAINLMDAKMPDNAGFLPRELPIVANGPAAYFSTLPLRRMVDALRAAGAAAQISNTAGTFVCNYLLYTLLHLAATQGYTMPCGFLHVPYLPEQLAGKPDATPCLELSVLVRALHEAVAALDAWLEETEPGR